MKNNKFKRKRSRTNAHAQSHTQVYEEYWGEFITIYNRVSDHFCI